MCIRDRSHSMAIFLGSTISLTCTSVECPYISHSHFTVFPFPNFPLDFVNQKWVVTDGSIKALNTSFAGFRIIIWHFTISASLYFIFFIWINWILPQVFVFWNFYDNMYTALKFHGSS